jgi:8-oxo-dGTP pyrophosphatase MutT (NUDIX family)
MWLPPGGHLELNEDPVQGACREAEEESGLQVEVIPPPGLLAFEGPGPEVLAPPIVILVEDIVRDDQPFHQHIDHVYFTRPVGRGVDFEAAIPHGPHRWATLAELERAFSLPAPDGTVKAVAEDVRLLGLQAIHAAAKRG